MARGKTPRECPDVEGLRRMVAEGRKLTEIQEHFCIHNRGLHRWLRQHGLERPKAKFTSKPGEVWRPVVGWEGHYEVSNIGRVRSLNRLSSIGRPIHGRIRRQALSCKKYPYWQVHLFRGGRGSKVHRLFVHQLVLEAFVGPRPDGMVACHNNGNPLENRLENLRWDTLSANSQDMLKHGTHSSQIRRRKAAAAQVEIRV